MPHGHSYLWNPNLVRLHLLTDLAIGVSYLAISVTLLYLVWRARRDVAFSWIFVCFGVFVLACGGNHFMEVWTLWTPVYWLSGAVKFVAATASVLTAIVLPSLVPKALTLIHAAKSLIDIAARAKFKNSSSNWSGAWPPAPRSWPKRTGAWLRWRQSSSTPSRPL
jgi:hypothetical protein